MERRCRRWKRLSAALLAMFLAGSTLAQVTLTFYHFGDATQMAYLEPMIEAFEAEHPNINIESVLSVEGGYEALLQKIRLAAAAGDTPDLAQVGYTYIPSAVNTLGAVNLEPFIEQDAEFGIDALIPAMAGLGRVSGDVYAIPLATSTPVLYVNADAFREAGLDPQNPPRTWAEAKAAAQKLEDAGYEGAVWGWDITGNWIFQTMIESAGGKLASEDGRTAAFNSEAGLEALQYLGELSSEGLMPMTNEATNLFRSGRLGMLISTSNSLTGLERDAAFEVVLAPIPIPEGGERALPGGGNALMMFSKDQAKQEAVWEFLRFAAGEEAGRIVAENSGYLPSNAQLVSQLGEDLADQPNRQILLSQLPQVIPWHSWPGANGTRIVQAIKDMQESVLLGRAEPAIALERTEADVNRLLQR
jgi:multiple sugar transport system substrate-binding protein